MKIVKAEKLYHKNGYINMNYIMNLPFTFIVLVGARGTGKTYGAVEELLTGNQGEFLFLRRTETEHEITFNEKDNLFQQFNSEIICEKVKGYCNVLNGGERIGCTSALATFHNLRGVALSFIKIIVYDEAIPEAHVRSIKNEYDVILNMYETVNRNRELAGDKPVKLIMMSNSNRLDSPLIVGLSIADDLMQGGEVYEYPDRGLLVINAQNKGFREKKKKTALYRLADENSRFGKMALDNLFDGVSSEDVVKKVNVKEYKSFLTLKWNSETFYINMHKKDDFFYISKKHNLGGSDKVVRINIENERIKFLKDYNIFLTMLLNNRIFFDSYDTKLKFELLLKNKLT